MSGSLQEKMAQFLDQNEKLKGKNVRFLELLSLGDTCTCAVRRAFLTPYIYIIYIHYIILSRLMNVPKL